MYTCIYTHVHINILSTGALLRSCAGVQRRFHFKDLDQPSHQPSMHLAKAYQDCEYALANKVLHMHTDIRPTHVHTQI